MQCRQFTDNQVRDAFEINGILNKIAHPGVGQSDEVPMLCWRILDSWSY